MLCVIVALLGFVAMSVDMGAVVVARRQVQEAADTAALGATTRLDSQPQAARVADAYAGEVRMNGRVAHIDAGDVIIGTWSGTSFAPGGASPNAVRVKAYADVPLTLTRLFGVDTLRVSAAAIAGPRVVARRAPDIVVALDVTASMDAAELAQERVAALALLDCVHDRSTGDSRMGIVLFTGVDTTRSEMLEVGADYTRIAGAIAGIRGCGTTGMPACSGTNQAAGMGAARVMLDGAGTPEGVGQVILLESDGEPNPDSICVAGNYTGRGWRPELQTLCAGLTVSKTTCTGSGSRRRCTTTVTQGQPSLANYQAWADNYAASAEAAGIDIYTVYFGTDPTGISWLEDHVSAGAGLSLVAPTAAQMEQSFEDVCRAYTGASAGLLN